MPYVWSGNELAIKLSGYLNTGHMIWCRNGSVVAAATPCEELTCCYKDCAKDVMNGCLHCGAFCVTKASNDWLHAVHVD